MQTQPEGIGKRNVILTGHSLGGSVANIVGSKYWLKSVSFSPPGIYWGHRKFGIKSIDRIDAEVYSIVPERDFGMRLISCMI